MNSSRCPKIVGVLCLLAAMSLAQPSALAADSNGPLRQFRRQAMGEWSTRGNVIVQTDPKELATLLTGSADNKRFAASVRVRLTPESATQVGEAGLLMRFRDPDHYLAYSLKQKEGGLFAVLQIANKKPDLSMVADQAPVGRTTGGWHLLKVEVDGADVQTYLDGKPLLSFSFWGTPPPYNSQGVTWSPDPVEGWTGLITDHMDAEFTDFHLVPNAKFAEIVTPQKGRFDAQHHLLARQSYADTMAQFTDWLMRSDDVVDKSFAPAAIRNEPVYLLTNFIRSDDTMYDVGGEFAFNHALMISGAIEYYVYSGNRKYLTLATTTADWEIAHSTPADWALPYLAPSFVKFNKDGSWQGQEWGYEPDKSAYMAVSYLKLYEVTSDTKYLDAATRIGETLKKFQGEDGSWPFRVNAKTGEVKYGYTCSQLWYVWLYQRLAEVTGNKSYLKLSDSAFQWLLNNPVKTNEWIGLYGDIASGARSFDQWVAQETAIYLIDHRVDNPAYVQMAKGILDWVNRVLVVDYGFFPSVPGVVEQSQYRVVLTHHELRLAELYAKLWEATGDLSYKEKAIETANSVTWNLMSDGKMRQGYFYHAWGIPLIPSFNDQFARVMACIPETGPKHENHVLQTTSLMKTVEYGPKQIRYQTVAQSYDEVMVASAPKAITAGTESLPRTSDPRMQHAGWTYDAATGLLKVSHPEGPVTISLQ